MFPAEGSHGGIQFNLDPQEGTPLPSFNDLLFDALTSDDKDGAIAILNKSGKKLGSFHGTAESVRVTPYDPKRWNSRIAKMEEDLRARSIWRAPHSRFSDCMISIGDIRFDHISEDFLKICRPRLSDALMRPVCEFPAIRDLASLVHDLSRLHYSSGSKARYNRTKESSN